MDTTEYDLQVFRNTSKISRQCFPVVLDFENPKFIARMNRMVENTRKVAGTRRKGGPIQALRRGGLLLANAFLFGRLYFMKAHQNEVPENFRMQPAY